MQITGQNAGACNEAAVENRTGGVQAQADVNRVELMEKSVGTPLQLHTKTLPQRTEVNLEPGMCLACDSSEAANYGAAATKTSDSTDAISGVEVESNYPQYPVVKREYTQTQYQAPPTASQPRSQPTLPVFIGSQKPLSCLVASQQSPEVEPPQIYATQGNTKPADSRTVTTESAERTNGKTIEIVGLIPVTVESYRQQESAQTTPVITDPVPSQTACQNSQPPQPATFQTTVSVKEEITKPSTTTTYSGDGTTSNRDKAIELIPVIVKDRQYRNELPPLPTDPIPPQSGYADLNTTTDVKEDVCSLPIEPGMCLASIPRWGKNPKTGKCEQFIYGGCGGNANSFSTKEECEKACGCSEPVVTESSARSYLKPVMEDKYTQTPYEASPVVAETTTRQRRSLAFEPSLTSPQPPQPVTPKERPQIQPPRVYVREEKTNSADSGSAKRTAYLTDETNANGIKIVELTPIIVENRQQYHFYTGDKQSGQTRLPNDQLTPLILNGDLSPKTNANRPYTNELSEQASDSSVPNKTASNLYQRQISVKTTKTTQTQYQKPTLAADPTTRQSCPAALQPVLTSPQNTGAVSGYSVGATSQQLPQVDAPTTYVREENTPSEICSLPLETGPCRAYLPQWGRNPETGECERFTYGGCGGNANRFNTREECERACGIRRPVEYQAATRTTEPTIGQNSGGAMVAEPKPANVDRQQYRPIIKAEKSTQTSSRTSPMTTVLTSPKKTRRVGVRSGLKPVKTRPQVGTPNVYLNEEKTDTTNCGSATKSASSEAKVVEVVPIVLENRQYHYYYPTNTGCELPPRPTDPNPSQVCCEVKAETNANNSCKKEESVTTSSSSSDSSNSERHHHHHLLHHHHRHHHHLLPTFKHKHTHTRRHSCSSTTDKTGRQCSSQSPQANIPKQCPQVEIPKVCVEDKPTSSSCRSTNSADKPNSGGIIIVQLKPTKIRASQLRQLCKQGQTQCQESPVTCQSQACHESRKRPCLTPPQASPPKVCVKEEKPKCNTSGSSTKPTLEAVELIPIVLEDRQYYYIADGLPSGSADVKPPQSGGCDLNPATDVNNDDTNCSLPPETVSPKWAKNPETGKCEPIFYDECGDSANTFDTKEECERACGCSEPAETEGSNENYLIPVWQYRYTQTRFKVSPTATDATKRRRRSQPLQPIIISTQKPRNVNVESGCTSFQESPQTDLPNCFVKEEKTGSEACSTGVREVYILKWRKNPESGKCEQFSYDGSGDTTNCFDKREECEAACGCN